MKRRRQGPVVAIVVALAVAAAVAYAGADGGARTTAGVSVFALCAALAFAINWIAFVPAYLARSERYYDLVGSLTYVALVVTALTLGGGDPARPEPPPARECTAQRAPFVHDLLPATRRLRGPRTRI